MTYLVSANVQPQQDTSDNSQLYSIYHDNSIFRQCHKLVKRYLGICTPAISQAWISAVPCSTLTFFPSIVISISALLATEAEKFRFGNRCLLQWADRGAALTALRSSIALLMMTAMKPSTFGVRIRGRFGSHNIYTHHSQSQRLETKLEITLKELKLCNVRTNISRFNSKMLERWHAQCGYTTRINGLVQKLRPKWTYPSGNDELLRQRKAKTSVFICIVKTIGITSRQRLAVEPRICRGEVFKLDQIACVVYFMRKNWKFEKKPPLRGLVDGSRRLTRMSPQTHQFSVKIRIPPSSAVDCRGIQFPSLSQRYKSEYRSPGKEITHHPVVSALQLEELFALRQCGRDNHPYKLRTEIHNSLPRNEWGNFFQENRK
jgi:hypothetical protein